MIRAIARRLRRGPRHAYRSSVTGRYVSRLYALLHRGTTVKERLW